MIQQQLEPFQLPLQTIPSYPNLSFQRRDARQGVKGT